MAGKPDAYERDILNMLLNGQGIANVVDNAATSPLANLYLSLHTADPEAGATEAGTQSTAEVAYTGYGRVAIARSPGSPAWTVSTDGSGITKAVPNAVIPFGACTGGSAVATYFAVGSLLNGAGRIFYSGPITPSINISNGVTPQLGTSTNIQED